MTKDSTQPGAGSQTLDRGLSILQLLAKQPEGLTVSELAQLLGVHRAVVYRLVSTLMAHGLVYRTDSGQLRLWTGIVGLARSVLPDLRVAALPELERLAEETAATATLTIADGEEGVCIAVVEPKNTLMHVAYRTGVRHPLALGASGKAILAGSPAQLGENPAVTAGRRKGYVRTEGELQSAAHGLAAPINSGLDLPAASVAIVSLTDVPESSATRVMDAARRIEHALRIGG